MTEDRRKKNANWTINRSEDGDYTVDTASLAVLMDLRDELQAIRRLMECPNVANGFRAMRDIAQRLARGIVVKRPKAKRRAKR